MEPATEVQRSDGIARPNRLVKLMAAGFGRARSLDRHEHG